MAHKQSNVKKPVEVLFSGMIIINTVNRFIKQFAKYGGFTAMGLEWFALLFFYLREPTYFTGQYPISHFASLPSTQLVFSLCYVLAAISFWIYAKYHLKNHFETPMTTFALSMLAFAAVALVPYDPSNLASSTVHALLVTVSWLLFFVGMVIMAAQSTDKGFSMVTLAAVALSVLLMAIFIFMPPTSPLLLAFEAGSWLVCQLWIIWLSVLTLRRPAVLDSVQNKNTG